MSHHKVVVVQVACTVPVDSSAHVVGHSPLKYARSSQIVPFGK
ncbi:MAG: hypothetical protein WCI00_09080 [bacterium]